MTYQFEPHEHLTTIALATRPEGLVQDIVCPSVDVPTDKFKYTEVDVGSMFTIPDVQISPGGMANTVRTETQLRDDSVNDYGLLAQVPHKARQQYMGGATVVDPLELDVMSNSMLVALAREKRCADLIFNAASYNADFRTTLAGDSQWSHEDSNPVDAILEAIDSMIIKPNMLVLGRSSWRHLRQNPNVVAAVNPTGAGVNASGVARREAVAEALEIERIVVGEPFINTAHGGQDAAFAHLWGKHASLLRVESTPPTTETKIPTFSFTASQYPRVVTEGHDEKASGPGGVYWAKVVESCKELVSYKHAGYLFQNAVA